MANHFYYYAKLSVKNVFMGLIITFFWNTQNAPDCTIQLKKSGVHAPGPPSADLNPTSLQGYLRASYVVFDEKRNGPHFLGLHFFGFRGLLPPDPPCKNVKVFIFVLTCASGLILEKNMAQNLGC